MYYWEYIVQIWDEDDQKFKSCSGFVVGEEFSEVMGYLEDYYGDELCEVHMLKPISDSGEVFDFESNSTECDFSFMRKESV